MSSNLTSRRIPLRTRSTASVTGTQAKENVGTNGVSSRAARYGTDDAGPSKVAVAGAGKPSTTAASSAILGTRKRTALGDLTNANRTRVIGGDLEGGKGKASLKEPIKARATTSTTTTRPVATTTTTGVGAARRVVRAKSTEDDSAADRPVRVSRRVASTTSTSSIPTAATSTAPAARTGATSSAAAAAAAAARRGQMARTTSGNSQTGREASIASVKSRGHDVEVEAPQAKRLKTDIVQPAKDAGWEDLDAEDAEDPLMVAEYVNDIFEYMKELEIVNMPSGDYMTLQKDINWDVRAILVDWLVDIHAKFRLLPETLYLAVNIIDRFLSRRTISLSKLQLVGVSAMFIASKYEEVLCPSIQNFFYLADGGYTDVEILQAERYMLKVLDFSLSYANPMNFLRRISKADNYDIQTRTVAKYFMEISLLDYRLMEHPPSLIAAASVWLAREVLERGEWTPTLVHYSTYSEQELLGTAEIMLDYCLRPVAHPFFHKKYAHKKFMRASTYVIDWARSTFPESVVMDDDEQDLDVLRVDLFGKKEIERPEQSPIAGSSAANTPARELQTQASFEEDKINAHCSASFDGDDDASKDFGEQRVDREALKDVTNDYDTETF